MIGGGLALTEILSDFLPRLTRHLSHERSKEETERPVAHTSPMGALRKKHSSCERIKLHHGRWYKSRAWLDFSTAQLSAWHPRSSLTTTRALQTVPAGAQRAHAALLGRSERLLLLLWSPLHTVNQSWPRDAKSDGSERNINLVWVLGGP